ncbi:type I-C CRISPR-associated protein Cas5c [Dictyobacter aurantiacus]|uniref:pre-crRNA processing endonuclease n=1 Tax=Dictyobacter aurantiacus TaxID=1936993 RepID=A0A401ZH05_9CHLR|nr:type I-C CRISPR-associated protein Cas5c [Dictyobacter aurantiacus]GCE06139.1 type I-C CRISPR-associated protein Cas5 [Dictyobacter aurantiacus]
MYTPVEVCVWGKFACFTRPEMKVERVSYEVMTPSAARGVLEAIFWKPEFQWRVREIRVLKPIRHFSVLRNEVNSRASYGVGQRSLQGEKGFYAEEDRSQRHTLCLRDVAYSIAADVVVRPGVQEDAAKYRDQFQRRVKRGQCYSMPYLGCREFPAQFGPEIPETEDAYLQDINIDLGRMLFDLDYEPDGSGRGQPRFFPASLHHGVLRIPETLYGKDQ